MTLKAKTLFGGSCEFMLGVAELHQLPPDDKLEICFAGRSNVGKSSLLNALVGQKNLARTSNTPGRTQQLNFFDLGGLMYMVDLPGYGYAKAPVAIVRKWQQVLEAYLCGRANLRRAFILVDSRHGVKDLDHEIMDMLDKAAVSFQVVLTKADKIKPSQHADVIHKTIVDIKRHTAAYPDILLTSSEKSLGILELQQSIADLLQN
jgi:GTP-binding protein